MPELRIQPIDQPLNALDQEDINLLVEKASEKTKQLLQELQKVLIT